MIRFFNKKKKKGFTLVELVVNMAIIGIIMVIVTSLTGLSMQSFNRHNKINDAIVVGDLVISAIEGKISKVNHAKLEERFVPTEIKDASGVHISWKDFNQDGEEDKAICNKDGYEYPICLYDLKKYNTIFQVPSTNKKLNSDLNALEGVKRKGKLYYIEKTINASEKADATLGSNYNGYTVIDSSSTEEIIIKPLMNESLYRGYSVDVYYEYVAIQENNKKDSKEDAQTKVKPVGRQDSIVIHVDVYDGDKLVHKSNKTITFLQRYFKMDNPYGLYTGSKNVILYR